MSKIKVHKNIQPYIPFVEGVIALFHPFVEAAVHDLTKGKIVALYNNISKRNVGDASPLKELHMPLEKFPDVFDPYYKTNWDGKQLKCTSLTIRDDKKNPIGLICFNFDTTVFRNLQLNLDPFLSVKQKAENPIEIYKDNWQEKITDFVKKLIDGKYTEITRLPGEKKKHIVQLLYQHGFFNYKNAVLFVADLLGISRATVYNYLK